MPFTTKQDLRDYYPFELFAADKKDIVRIHASSGTTGRQIVAGYTRNDLDMWADCMARQIAAAGGDENSVVQCHTVTACSQAVWVHTAVLKESVL